ncbi:MAG: hypothetical protein ACI8ZO_001059 [Flavobacteriales bacterium]
MAIEGFLTIADNHFSIAGIFEMHKPTNGLHLPVLFLGYRWVPYVGLYDNSTKNDDIRIGATELLD